METRALDSWMSAKGRKTRGKRMRPNSAMEVKMEAGVKESGDTAGGGSEGEGRASGRGGW